MHIVIARHGKPNLRRRGWITPRQMDEWIYAYNQADVILDGIPNDIVKIASTSGVIVASTLPRCIQSAQHLSPNRAFLTEGIFCEAGLPYPNWNFPKLPLPVWNAIFRLAWFRGFSANAESFTQATARAHTAAERLMELAKKFDSVFLVGHGIMAMLIAKHLLACGWSGPKRPVGKYWQCSVYRAA